MNRMNSNRILPKPESTSVPVDDDDGRGNPSIVGVDGGRPSTSGAMRVSSIRNSIAASFGVAGSDISVAVAVSICEGHWDSWDNSQYEPNNIIGITLMQIAGASVFTFSLFVFCLPYTDCPIWTDIPPSAPPTEGLASEAGHPGWEGHKSELGNRLVFQIITWPLATIPLFSTLMFEPHAHTWENFHWWIWRCTVPAIVWCSIVMEIFRETAPGKIESTSGREAFFVAIGFQSLTFSLVPFAEAFARVLGCEHWKNLYKVLMTPDEELEHHADGSIIIRPAKKAATNKEVVSETGDDIRDVNAKPNSKGYAKSKVVPCSTESGRESTVPPRNTGTDADRMESDVPAFRKILMRQLVFGSLWGTINLVGSGFIILDVVVLRFKSELYWKLLRPGMLLCVKRSIYYVDNMCFQRSRCLLPVARHYTTSPCFAICGLINAVYLCATPDWLGFGLFLMVDWISYIMRVWCFSGHGEDIPFLKSLRDCLLAERMLPVGQQSPRVLHGWFLICEGLWQTIGYFTLLLLYPVSLYMDENYPTTYRSETTGEIIAVEKSILNWAFFRTPEVKIFIAIAAVNDYLQDYVVHQYAIKKTGCNFTRHLGKCNWKGQLFFLAAGWTSSWFIFPLVYPLKIARYYEIVKN